jgi:hypothetical protein
MGWLDIALDADAATQAAIIVNKIENAIEADAPPYELEPLVGMLKNALSDLRTAAEELTGRRDYPQKIISGGMILLEMRLQESLITPEHFLNQADIDYADSAIQLIRGQGNRLITQLSPTDQDEVRDMVLNARRMADYGHFIDHFKDGDELLTAADVVEWLSWRNSLGGLLVLWIGFILILIGLATIPIIMLTNDQVISAYIGFAFLVIIAVVGFIFTSRWIKASEFKEAMAIIEDLGDRIDIDRFETIYKELNGNKNRAIGFQKSAQVVVEKFFLGLPMPNLREYILEPEGMNLDEEEIPDLPAEHTPAYNPLKYMREITDQPSDRSTSRRGRSVTAKVRPSIQPPLAATSPRFCGECGAKTPPGAAFCPNCGNRLH